MLLHAMQMWPNMISLEFWSHPFMHAVHLHNCTPWSNEKNSLFTLFTDEDPTYTLNDFKVFGSLVYVLDPYVQTSTLSPGKWKKCPYQGVYVGHLPQHASNVILVYNPKTWLVSPQYHVIHNELFETVQINMSEADAQQKLDKMLDALFVTSWWIHTDAYLDCDPLSNTHHYLDNSWDLTNETIHATHLRKCACDQSHNGMAVSKGESRRTSHNLAHTHVDLPLE